MSAPTKAPRRPRINVDMLVLAKGAHPSPDAGLCVMELAAYLAREPHSDRPACVSPVLGAYLRAWNDALPDEPRQRLRPYAARVLNTAGDPAAEECRAWMATDWIVRVYTPAWLELAGLAEDAATLRALPEVLSENVDVAIVRVRAAGVRSAAAWDAARDAARAAAWDAARDAARAAAWAAARDAAVAAAWAAARDAAGAAAWAAARAAARDAARDAARAAARDAAWAAAWAAARAAAWAAARDAAGETAKAKLAPTVTALQESAFGLLDRMIAVQS